MKKRISVFTICDKSGKSVDNKVYLCKGVAHDCAYLYGGDNLSVRRCKLIANTEGDNDFVYLDKVKEVGRFESCDNCFIHGDFGISTNGTDADMVNSYMRKCPDNNARTKLEYVPYTLVHDKIKPNPKVMYVMMHRSEQGGFYAKVNMFPQLNGTKSARNKLMFSHRNWYGVCEGPAYVTIVEDSGKYGFILGSMVRFDTVSATEAMEFAVNNYKDKEHMTVFHPIRGHYFVVIDKEVNKYYIVVRDENGNLHLDDSYSDIVENDVNCGSYIVEHVNYFA